jgi:hypothetical protein
METRCFGNFEKGVNTSFFCQCAAIKNNSLKGVFMKQKAVVFILLFILVSSVTAWAAVSMEEQVTKLYVATFNRAPDAAGLDYWVNTSGLTIEEIANAFFDASETRTRYPEGTTDEAFVTAIYQNVFSREPDSGGLDFWVGEGGLGGGVPRSEMILTVIGGARNADADVLANKTEVGLYFADELGLGGDGPFSLEDVTNDRATVNAAMARADGLVSVEDVSIDTGTINSPEVIDAGNGAFNFTDDASVFTNVVIHNFSSDDTINIRNAAVGDYGFSNDGADMTVSYNYNDEGMMNIIQLTGVVSGEDVIYDQASFTAAIGFYPFAG